MVKMLKCTKMSSHHYVFYEQSQCHTNEEIHFLYFAWKMSRRSYVFNANLSFFFVFSVSWPCHLLECNNTYYTKCMYLYYVTYMMDTCSMPSIFSFRHFTNQTIVYLINLDKANDFWIHFADWLLKIMCIKPSLLYNK